MMDCPTCNMDMTVLGCRVSFSTFHWCPNCGTIAPCTGEVVVPLIADPLAVSKLIDIAVDKTK